MCEGINDVFDLLLTILSFMMIIAIDVSIYRVDFLSIFLSNEIMITVVNLFINKYYKVA